MDTQTDSLPMIGIQIDDTVVLKDTKPERTRRRPKLEIVGGEVETASDTSGLVDPNGGVLTSLTWPRYLEWRKTKCRPFDYERGPALATNPDAAKSKLANFEPDRQRALEEIDQAVHEFVGEVAELGELFMQAGSLAFYGDTRMKLIDDCGDILFCGVWCFDAWGFNPLADADDLELIRVTNENPLAMMARIMACAPAKEVLSDGEFVGSLLNGVCSLMVKMQTNAGLLCNSFKKLRYQRRKQEVELQVARIATSLLVVNQILVLANSSVEEALTVNMQKLNARYPDGYVAGQGGGNRTGEGE